MIAQERREDLGWLAKLRQYKSGPAAHRGLMVQAVHAGPRGLLVQDVHAVVASLRSAVLPSVTIACSEHVIRTQRYS